MRNLLLLHAHRQTDGALAGLTAPQLIVDQNRAHIAYVAAATGVHRLDTATATSTQLIAADDDVLVGVQHLSLNDELCTASAAGDVRVHSLANGGRTETVGFCPGGIRCMAWSPDQEAVAFVTGDGVLIVMDTLYTPVAECVLSEAGFGDGAFVNVGWGAKETQFHGTAGKAARHQPVDQPDATLGQATAMWPDDSAAESSVQIVWRGDAEYFAVSFAGGPTGRQFKVFNKEGTLQFTSEPTAGGLSGAIAWRPSGTWLAVPQVLSNRYVIALFEKNGLKHREIVLPFAVAAERVRRLEWSSDSDVLAVETLRQLADGEWRSRIYLYTMGNYHWYQKQTLDFAATADKRVVHFVWDCQLTEGRRLHVLCADGEYSVFRWIAEVNGSRTHGADDEAVVAVVDGRVLRLTGCRGAVVPPPMCSLEVKLEQHVNWVAFVAFVGEADREAGAVNRFVTVDVDNVLRVFSCHTTNGLLKEVRPLGEFRMPTVNIPLYYTHWLYLTENTIIYATADVTTAADASPRLHLGQLVDNEVKLIASISLPAAGQIHCLCGVSPTEIAVATTAGLFRIPLATFADVTGALAVVYTYPDAAEHLCCSADGQNVFALKPKHWLYHNGRSVASGVTSMHMAEQYLLFTTLDVLRFVRLADGAIVGDRRIERGARLVAVVPQDCRTVLQMPRGNLEAIQPRVLALCIIGRLLDDGSYHRAFDAMRKQRINLNLLMDHAGDAFLQRVPEFVRSVRNGQWLNLFLSDLDEADVTVTMYGSNYPGRTAAAVPGGKVAEVCRRVREAVYELGLEDELLLTILTSFVRQREYEPALRLLWQIKRAEVGAAGSAVRAVSAADALKHLLYLADVNELYNVALGMYEFDLVRFIAAKSQKDPKEYLPHLAGLEQIDDRNYRSYRVDLHLKRFERALGHIAGCLTEHADECVELVQKQSMFAVALRLFEGLGSAAGVEDTYARIQHAYAEHLRENGKFRDACLMYERCGAYAQAILSARHILDWQKCVGLARRMGQTDEEIGQLAGSLVPALVENGQRLDAAQLVLKYQQDVGQAVGILCDGRFYVQALFEARMGDESLIESIVKPHLTSYADTLLYVLDADREQFLEYKQRLAIVRADRAAARQSGHPDGEHLHHDDPDADAFSDTSSMRSSRHSASSRGTGKTHRSSKNRRKHERKLLSLKPGNPFEDIALIDALHALALKAFDQQTAVRALCKALIDQRLDRLGQRVQQTLRELLRTVSGSLDAIWIAEMMVAGECVPLAEDGRLDYALVQQEQHYAMIKPHQRYKPQLKAIDWEFDVLE